VKKLILMLIILFPAILTAGNPTTVCHTELSSWIQSKQKLSIVDIQSPDDFRTHNYDNSIATHNDPVRIKNAAAPLRSNTGKIVIVSATGGADASKVVDQLVGYGVARSRLLLLEGGMKAAVAHASCECCKPAAPIGAVK
jgi:rhodanese-related sulfurtransferase